MHQLNNVYPHQKKKIWRWRRRRRNDFWNRYSKNCKYANRCYVLEISKHSISYTEAPNRAQKSKPQHTYAQTEIETETAYGNQNQEKRREKTINKQKNPYRNQKTQNEIESATATTFIIRMTREGEWLAWRRRCIMLYTLYYELQSFIICMCIPWLVLPTLPPFDGLINPRHCVGYPESRTW